VKGHNEGGTIWSDMRTYDNNNNNNNNTNMSRSNHPRLWQVEL
jgi:hypothetical protein